MIVHKTPAPLPKDYFENPWKFNFSNNIFFLNGRIMSGPKMDWAAVGFVMLSIIFFGVAYSILIGSNLSKNWSIATNIIV